jgi:hypothetical protein
LTVILPLDAVVAFGILFTTSTFQYLEVIFLLFACVLDIPAILVMIFNMRIGSLFLLLNASVSFLMAMVFFASHGSRFPSGLLIQIAIFWLPKAIIGILGFYSFRNPQGRITTPTYS